MLTRKKQRLSNLPKCFHPNCPHLGFLECVSPYNNTFYFCHQHAHDFSYCIWCGAYAPDCVLSQACEGLCRSCDEKAKNSINVEFGGAYRYLYERARPIAVELGLNAFSELPLDVFCTYFLNPLCLFVTSQFNYKLSFSEYERLTRYCLCYMRTEPGSMARVVWSRSLFGLGFLDGFIYNADSSYKTS
jgi:hypothetical protein